MQLFSKVIFILLPFISFGQNQTFLGLELDPKFELYQSVDSDNRLSTPSPFYSLIFYGDS